MHYKVKTAYIFFDYKGDTMSLVLIWVIPY